MTKPIKSIHDLTRCTACRAHIRAADRPSTTVCPFCGANLHTGRALIALPAGRSTLLAASLLAFSACGGGQVEPSEPTTEPTATTTEPTATTTEPTATTTEPAAEPSDPSANQNQDPPDQYDRRPADVHISNSEYGLSPFDDYVPERADNPPPMPRYGLPPSRR